MLLKIIRILTFTIIIFLFITTFSFISYSHNYVSVSASPIGTNNFKEVPIMHLSIPKIKVNNDVYSKDSINNDIDKNIEIMKDSDMPDKQSGNVIIGGHSGTGRLAYFKDLYLLDIDDLIYLNYDKQTYTYKISKVYSDYKDGSIVIRRDINENSLTLFTCNPNDKENYLVIIANLI